MKQSISKRIGMIIFLSLSVSLAIMIIVLLTVERSSKMSSTKSDIYNLSQSINKSVVFAMSQGTTDIHPMVDKMKGLENLAELRIIPTDKIIAGSQNQMDKVEADVIRSKKSVFLTEEFKNIHVSRIVDPILSDETCNGCHSSTTGEPLAVISIRYSMEKMNADISKQSYLAILLALGSIFGTILLSMFFLKKEVIKDLAKSVKNIGQLAQGDVANLETTERKDEIGELNNSLKKLQLSMAERARIGNNIACGNFDDEIVLLSEKDLLGKSFQKITSNVQELIKDAEKLSNSAIEGDLSYRINQEKHKGEFGKIIAGINNTLNAVTHPIKEGVEALDRMSKGDLTVSIISSYKGDHAIIKDSINALSESLRFTMNEIKKAIQAAATSANQIASSSDQMAAGAQEQSQQTSEVAGAVEELSSTISNVTRDAFVAAETLKNARGEAIEGGNIVKLTIEGMNKIAEVVTEASATVEHLGVSSNQIGEIIQVIDDIADQTNLLALNAAIEAARAGEQGRGFAVVADEVRKLAERTIKATKEIASMINKIQEDTRSAVSAIRNGTEEVERGKQYALKSGEALNKIIDDVNKSADITMQAVAANEEMSSGADVISRNIEGISNQVQQAAAGTEQFARAAEDLHRLTINLQNLVNQFNSGNVQAGSSIAVSRSSSGKAARRSLSRI